MVFVESLIWYFTWIYIFISIYSISSYSLL